MMDNVKISGFTVLFIGVAVLLFTFACAYQFLIGVVNITASEDLMNLFGEVLAPLIMYAIRALFLGVMGWIGSILTRRGVQTITSAPKEGKTETTTKTKETKETEKAKGAENKK
jgi:hypothetical protein